MAEHDPHSPPSGFPETQQLEQDTAATADAPPQPLMETLRALLRTSFRADAAAQEPGRPGDWLDTTAT